MGGGLRPQPAFPCARRPSAPPARRQLQNKNAIPGGGVPRKEGIAKGEVRGGEREEGGGSRLENRANSAALPCVPAGQGRPAPPSRGPGALQPSPRLLLRAASHLASALAQSRRQEGGNDPGTREPESLRGWSLGPPPPLLSLRLSALAGRHLTPPWLERPAVELASHCCLASWTPSSSCLFRDANGVKLPKFAKRGAARSTAPEPGWGNRAGRGEVRVKPCQLGLGSRVAGSPSHLPIPHSCSAGTGSWRSSEIVFRRGRNGLRVPGV